MRRCDMDGLCCAANIWLDNEDFWTWYAYDEDDTDTSKPVNCPLIELPPHGRLIDADALELDAEWSEREDGFISFSSTAIKNAPTIIPADKGGDTK